MKLQRNLIISYVQEDKTEGKRFAFAGKWFEHLESRDILCVQHPKTLSVSTNAAYDILMGRIHCVYNNVFYRLYVAASQSKNDRREWTLSLNAS